MTPSRVCAISAVEPFPMVEAADRRARAAGPLPDVRFPAAYLDQRPQSAGELKAAAAWFVYACDDAGRPIVDGGGRRVHNPMFAHLEAITEERRGPLLQLLLRWLGNPVVRGLMRVSGIDSPYADDGVTEIARIAFGSVIRPEFADPGMQYFYEVIAPVYEFFHQFNTGVVPVCEAGDFVQLGPLPLGLIRSRCVAPNAPLYPNDAVGRDRLAAELVAHLSTLEPGPRRILAVGDGPGLTAFKTLLQALDRGLERVTVVVLETNPGQVDNGRRGWERLLAGQQGARLRAAGLSVEWVVGSGAERMFPEGHFDAAFSTYVVGAMGHRDVVEAYGRETLRALAPGGRHLVLDFYDRDSDPEGYATEGVEERGQWAARASARLMGWLADPQLHQTYAGIWDHHLDLNDVLDEASRAAGASVQRTHRQTTFVHVPLFRLGPWTLTFSFSGYNERRAVYTKAR